MSFKAVNFDLDGTLLNTLEDIANSANHVLAGYGYTTHNLNAYRSFVGEGVTVLIVRALPGQKRDDQALIKRCVEAFIKEYRRNWKVNTRPYEGVAEMLDVAPDRIPYVGDSDIDMKTATSAGIFPVGALWGFRSQEELEANGARALIERPPDILDLLNSETKT